MTEAWINGIGTAVPPHDIHRAFVARGLAVLPDERSRSVFGRMAGMSGIAHRYAIFPPAFSSQGEALDAEGFYRLGAFPGTARRMERYHDEALKLALQATQALELGDGTRRITHLIVASCTGFAAPGLDFRLMQALGLPGSTERMLIGFMGCFAAVTALRSARHIVRADPAAHVLVVCVELCSLHLQETLEIGSMLSLLLFGDGAAAALVSADPTGVELRAFRAEVLPDTEGLITWDIGDSGFLMRLSGRVPALIRQFLCASGKALLDRLGVPAPGAWAVHAGGRTILDAVQEGLGLEPRALLRSRSVLHDFGNLSSGTLLFVLERLMRETASPTAGVAMAFGPGLTVESFGFRLARGGFG